MELGLLYLHLDMGNLQQGMAVLARVRPDPSLCLRVGHRSGRKGKRVGVADPEVGQHRPVQEHPGEMERRWHDSVLCSHTGLGRFSSLCSRGLCMTRVSQRVPSCRLRPAQWMVNGSVTSNEATYSNEQAG